VPSFLNLIKIIIIDNPIKTIIAKERYFLRRVFLMRELNCIRAVDITHITSRVVDDG
jgi:hypothetical protein